MKIKYTRVQYLDINLKLADSPKLRGYFGQKYRDNIIMHNHNGDKFIYSYPLVQYKVIDHAPTLIGLGDGAELLLNVGVCEHELDIGGIKHEIGCAKIDTRTEEVGISDTITKYKFETPWLPLNQYNTPKYIAADIIEREEKLKGILINNLIALSKAVHYQVPSKIRVSLNVHKVDARFKNNDMLGFVGSFNCNFTLPDYIGLGRAVSHGFGTIVRAK